ncbi:hypothetical protein ACR79T_17080 [Sphingobacterium spiritivorum]|uniref:hypothetical protein n=1 Tax=Sphingobacterium spiritivorum TaxID=258 RepID=UPI003DA436AD
MKKIFLIALLCFMAFLQGCSKKENDLDPIKNPNEINLPKESHEFGKAVAKEIRSIVLTIKKKGFDYSKLPDSLSYYDKISKDIYQASSNSVKTNSSIPQMIENLKLNDRLSNLSDRQIEFVNRIINEVNKSQLLKDLQKTISNLNKEISNNIPKIEQERLFNVTSVLYYSSYEIQKLEDDGHMVSLSKNGNKKLKSTFNRQVTIPEYCKRFMALGWAIAVGEPTPAGEIVMSVVTVGFVGALVLYEVVTCQKISGGKLHRVYCDYRWRTCYSPYPNNCSICLRYCLTQGVWPPYSSHRCS